MKKNQGPGYSEEHGSPEQQAPKRQKKRRLRRRRIEDVTSETQLLLDIEQKVEAVQPRDVRGKRRKYLQAAMVLVLGVISLVILMQVGAPGEGERLSASEIFSRAKVGYFGTALLLVAAMYLLDALKFSYIMRLALKKFRPLLSFKLGVLGRYYDNITPLSSGGEPYQMYYLAKHDTPIGASASIPLIKYFVQMFVWLLTSLVLFSVNSSALNSVAGGRPVQISISVAAYVGLALNSILPLTLVALTVLPKTGGRIVSFVLRAGVRLKLVKDYEKQLAKAYKLVEEFKSSMKYISSRIFHIFMIALVCLAELLAMLSVPYFLCLALGGVPPSAGLWLDIITLYLYQFFSVSFIPIPGTAGVAETMFTFAFSGIAMAGGVLFWVVLLWRVLTYYSSILLGILTVAYDFIKNSYKSKVIERKRLSSMREKLAANLALPDVRERMANLRVLKSVELEDRFFAPKPRPGDIKARLKSTYSSGSQPPALLAYRCYLAGSRIAGIADTATLAGAREFHDSCTILGLLPLAGAEISVKPPKPLRRGVKINNPFQAEIMTLSLFAIPPAGFEVAERELAALREKRNVRLRASSEKLNEWLAYYGIALDFDADVLPISRQSEGGAVTEQHIAAALANRLVELLGRGGQLLGFLTDELAIPLSVRMEKRLRDVLAHDYMADVASALTSTVRAHTLPADGECMTMADAASLARRTGAILVYPYLGDLEQMLLGEVRVEKFEDSFLDNLLFELSQAGVNAVSYNPRRITEHQQQRLRRLCGEYELMELCEGTIYPRQSQIQEPELTMPEHQPLLDGIYAAVGNARSASPKDAMFSASTDERISILADKIAVYSARGRRLQ